MEIQSTPRSNGPHTAPGVHLDFDPESNVTTITLPSKVTTLPDAREPLCVRLGATDTVLSSNTPTTPVVIRAHVVPDRQRRSVILEQPHPNPPSPPHPDPEENLSLDQIPRAGPITAPSTDEMFNESQRKRGVIAPAPRSPTTIRIPIPEKPNAPGPSMITVRAHAITRPHERVIIDVPPAEPRAPTIVHLSAPEGDDPNPSHTVEMPSIVRIPAVVERPQVLRVRQASS